MKKKIALVSAGLGNVYRGFEVSAALWYNELKSSDEISIKLFSGGNYKDAIRVWNCPRGGNIASLLRKLNVINDGCRFEQLTFSLGFLLKLVFYKPDFIWLQEGALANQLLLFKNLFKLNYKIIFCDGAPIGYEKIKYFDYLIFLHQQGFNDAVAAGASPERCIVIPHLTLTPDKRTDKLHARQIMGIDPGKTVIICVAAWNKHHKRIDYLLREVSKIANKNITLLLCGQREVDSQLLMDMADDLKLDSIWKTLSQDDLSVAYSCADLFVLPSLNEGLPAVSVEAASHNLPVICHPNDAGKFIFGEDYFGLTDLSVNGNLTDKIAGLIIENNLYQRGLETKEIVSLKFDKKILSTRFVNFIKSIS